MMVAQWGEIYIFMKECIHIAGLSYLYMNVAGVKCVSVQSRENHRSIYIKQFFLFCFFSSSVDVCVHACHARAKRKI